MSISPSFSTFEKLYNEGQPQILLDRVVSDLDTPVSAYLKLAGRRRNAFLLESVEGGEQLGRYSIIGLKPDIIWRCFKGKAQINTNAIANIDDFTDEDLPALESLKQLLAQSHIELPQSAPPMAAGVFGYLGYELVREAEHLPNRNPLAVDIPDGIFIRPTVVAVFDNIKQEIILVATARPEQDVSARSAYARAAERLAEAKTDLTGTLPAIADSTSPAAPSKVEPTSNTTPDEYFDMVRKAKEEIAAGEIFQVVLSQRFDAPFTAPPFSLYRSLRRLNPSPFLFYLDFDSHAVIGSSPEILVRVRDDQVSIRPIAGTRPRGKTPEEDQALELDLLADPKECAEHLMLLDLGRNDVGRVSTYGSVRVTEEFIVERYSHVMHIVSNVVGERSPQVNPVDAVMAGFPAGTVSGAPKIRAMEIIDELEKEARGAYAGAIGYFSADGNVDTAIALRTAIVKDGTMHVQAGAGIVADSNPQSEHTECVNKSMALFAAAQDAINSEGN